MVRLPLGSPIFLLLSLPSFVRKVGSGLEAAALKLIAQDPVDLFPDQAPEKHEVGRSEAGRPESLVGRREAPSSRSEGSVTAGDMTSPAERALPANSPGESREGDFGCTVMDLRKLMELRSGDAIDQIHAHYGGVANLCSRLKTNPVEGEGVSGGTGPCRPQRFPLPGRRRPGPRGVPVPGREERAV